MKRIKLRVTGRVRRKKGIRSGIFGMPSRPRLSVFRSSKHIYAQIIDDLSGQTLASASTMEKDTRSSGGGNAEAAGHVGKRLAERAVAAGVGPVHAVGSVVIQAFDANRFYCTFGFRHGHM